MLHHLRNIRKHASSHPFRVLLLLNVFFSAQVALTIYVDSSFLSETIGRSGILDGVGLWKDPEHMVGTLYTAASLITILTLLIVPKFLESIGNYRATLTAVVIHMLMLLGLSITDSAVLVIPMFIATNVLTAVLYFNIDIFIERFSKDEDTGRIRGLFMALGSMAWLLPPLFAGYIVEAKGYQMVYLVGAALVLPMVLLTMRYLNHFHDLKYDHVSFLMTREEVLRNRNLFFSLVVNFFLHFFYAWMIIYGPLYLHGQGFAWDEIGLMLTIALSAFVIFPYPAGILADKYLGEKELLVTGFSLMGISSIMFSLLGGSLMPFWIWILVMFIGRTGASITEAMSETYFFKQVDGKNPQLVGYFRRTRALAFIIAPILASVLLESGIVEIPQLFYVLAGAMVAAIFFALRLKDTK